ncbi:MAG: hypothetical protein KF773_26365 [Deltaproteobacteria bacterium]|nr:hypothetical protein [Deltaproteobacteria bacterium]MCW5808063.1 hypothetical protein [Deltaproteobacteria bacterium]
MKAVVLAFAMTACGLPSSGELAETPIALTPRRPFLAPPASLDDQDRYHLNRQLEEQTDGETAYREAGGTLPVPPARFPAPKKPPPPPPSERPPGPLPPRQPPVE